MTISGVPSDGVVLPVKPLTREGFEPFGDVIEASAAAQHFLINDGNTERFHDLASLSVLADGRLGLSLFRGQPHSLPLRIEKLERHPLGSQAFIPLSGEPYLVVVAPPGPPPDLVQVRVFRAAGSQGVNYAPGVWHHPLLVLNRVSDFAVIDRIGDGDNCEATILRQPGIISEEKGSVS